jgi:hypothetical protein
MAQELKIVINAVGKGIKQTTGSLVSGLNKSQKAYKAFNSSMSAGNRVMSGVTANIRNLVAAYAGFSAIAGATRIMQDSETAMYNMQASVNAANREFGNVGNVEEWESAISRMSEELKIYSDTALKNAVSRTVDMTKRLGLSKDQMEEVIKRSADLGAGKTTLEGSIERVTAALRGEAEASEFLGLTLNENYIKAWYDANAATEKAWKDLTDIEKAQIRYQVLLEQSDELQGRAAGSAETFAGSVALVRKEVEDAISGNQDLVEAMNRLAEVMRENADEIGLFVSQMVSLAARLVELGVKYKDFLAVIAGVGAALFAIGKLTQAFYALNAVFIVLTGGGIIRWFGTLHAALAGVAASTSALAIAFKGFVVFAAAQGVVNIYKAVRAFLDMRSAMKDAEEAQQNLFRTTDRVMKKYAEFKDIRLPDDFTGRAPEELEELWQGLQRSKAYWVALQQSLISRAEDTTFLGLATKDALAAQKELKTVDQRLKEIDGDLASLKDAGAAAGDGMKEPAEAIKATADQLEEFESQAKKAYESARDQAQKYAQEVISWEEKIKYARLSTADQIRALERKGLSEEQQWNDKRLQAEEKMTAARQALRENDFDLAEKLAKEAQGLYAGLAEEVKGIDEAGTEVVVKSIDDTKRIAIGGIKEVGAFVEQLYKTQKASAEQSRKQWVDTAAKIEEKLAWVSRARETQVAIDLPNLADAQRVINNLTKDETKHITVVVTERVRRVEARATGGRVGMNRGGRLPGFGGGDRIRALLEAGEFVIRKEAVKKYGSALFDALNSMRLPKMPRMPQVPGPLKFAQGGMVPSGGGEVMTIRFQAGGVELPLQVMGRRGTTRQQIREFDAELKKMGLARG